MNEKNSLTEGEIMKELLKFAFPVFLSFFFTSIIWRRGSFGGGTGCIAGYVDGIGVSVYPDRYQFFRAECIGRGRHCGEDQFLYMASAFRTDAVRVRLCCTESWSRKAGQGEKSVKVWYDCSIWD